MKSVGTDPPVHDDADESYMNQIDAEGGLCSHIEDLLSEGLHFSLQSTAQAENSHGVEAYRQNVSSNELVGKGAGSCGQVGGSQEHDTKAPKECSQA